MLFEAIILVVKRERVKSSGLDQWLEALISSQSQVHKTSLHLFFCSYQNSKSLAFYARVLILGSLVSKYLGKLQPLSSRDLIRFVDFCR